MLPVTEINCRLTSCKVWVSCLHVQSLDRSQFMSHNFRAGDFQACTTWTKYGECNICLGMMSPNAHEGVNWVELPVAIYCCVCLCREMHNSLNNYKGIISERSAVIWGYLGLNTWLHWIHIYWRISGDFWEYLKILLILYAMSNNV